MAKVKIHPAADLFPMMNEAGIKDLAEDIKANGLLHPIEFWEGQLIDGRHRLKACEIAGVEPIEVDVTGSGGDPYAYAISNKMRRHHLTKSQLALAAAKLKPIYARLAKEKQKESGGDRKSEAAKKSVGIKVSQPIDDSKKKRASRERVTWRQQRPAE